MPKHLSYLNPELPFKKHLYAKASKEKFKTSYCYEELREMLHIYRTDFAGSPQPLTASVQNVEIFFESLEEQIKKQEQS